MITFFKTFFFIVLGLFFSFSESSFGMDLEEIGDRAEERQRLRPVLYQDLESFRSADFSSLESDQLEANLFHVSTQGVHHITEEVMVALMLEKIPFIPITSRNYDLATSYVSEHGDLAQKRTVLNYLLTSLHIKHNLPFDDKTIIGRKTVLEAPAEDATMIVAPEGDKTIIGSITPSEAATGK